MEKILDLKRGGGVGNIIFDVKIRPRFLKLFLNYLRFMV